MNPYNVLPVWSFNGPSRHDGFNVVRFANLYWLVTVSGFQGSGCGGRRIQPTFSPAECRCVVFGGKEVLYRFCLAVSTTSWNILSTRFRVSSKDHPTNEKRLSICPEGRMSGSFLPIYEPEIRTNRQTTTRQRSQAQERCVS